MQQQEAVRTRENRPAAVGCTLTVNRNGQNSGVTVSGNAAGLGFSASDCPPMNVIVQ